MREEITKRKRSPSHEKTSTSRPPKEPKSSEKRRSSSSEYRYQLVTDTLFVVIEWQWILSLTLIHCRILVATW